MKIHVKIIKLNMKFNIFVFKIINNVFNEFVFGENISQNIYVSCEFCDYSGQIFLGKNHEQKKNPEFGGENRVAKSLGCSTLPAFRLSGTTKILAGCPPGQNMCRIC